MKSALVVFLKEVRENLRDRRTLINTLITGPMMAPLMFTLILNAAISRELGKAEKPLAVPVVGAEHAPNLIAALEQSNVEIKPAPSDPERAVREQDADLVLRIPADYGATWRKGESAQVELIYDASQQNAQGSVARLQSILQGYARRTGAMRLLARGLNPALVSPLVVGDRDQSTAQTRSGTMFAMLPYFFILAGFIGGMALAIDTTAGERERQSLEPLFVNPLARSQILIGKLGATSTFAMTTVLLSVVAFAIVGRFLPIEKLGMSLAIGPRFVALTLLVMLPLVFVLTSLQTLAAAFAKSYREAQTYLSLLMFVPIIPTLLLSLFPLKTQPWMYAVPLMGQQVVISRLLRFDVVTSLDIGLCFAGTAFSALVVYGIVARIYRGERLAISA